MNQVELNYDQVISNHTKNVISIIDQANGNIKSLCPGETTYFNNNDTNFNPITSILIKRDTNCDQKIANVNISI